MSRPPDFLALTRPGDFVGDLAIPLSPAITTVSPPNQTAISPSPAPLPPSQSHPTPTPSYSPLPTPRLELVSSEGQKLTHGTASDLVPPSPQARLDGASQGAAVDCSPSCEDGAARGATDGCSPSRDDGFSPRPTARVLAVDLTALPSSGSPETLDDDIARTSDPTAGVETLLQIAPQSTPLLFPFSNPPLLQQSAQAANPGHPPPNPLNLQQAALSFFHLLAASLPTISNPHVSSSCPPLHPSSSLAPGAWLNASTTAASSSTHYASLAGTAFPLSHPPQAACATGHTPPQSTFAPTVAGPRPTLNRTSSAPLLSDTCATVHPKAPTSAHANRTDPTAISAWSKPLSQSLTNLRPISLPPSMPNPIWDNKDPSLVFSKEMEDAGHLSLQHAAIGRFTGTRPSMEWLEQHIKLHWNLSSTCKLSLLANNKFLFRFGSAPDKQRLLSRSPIPLLKSKLLLQPWYPNADQDNGPSKVPVWVRIKGLPPHQWTNDIIFSIANVLGTPLKVDSHTAKQTFMTFARVCVDLDPAANRPTTVNLHFPSGASGEVHLELENPPCSLCAKRGHSAARCRIASEATTLKSKTAKPPPNSHHHGLSTPPQPSILGKAPQPTPHQYKPQPTSPARPVPTNNPSPVDGLPGGDGHSPQAPSSPAAIPTHNPFAFLDTAWNQLVTTTGSTAPPKQSPLADEAQLADVDWYCNSIQGPPNSSAAAPNGNQNQPGAVVHTSVAARILPDRSPSQPQLTDVPAKIVEVPASSVARPSASQVASKCITTTCSTLLELSHPSPASSNPLPDPLAHTAPSTSTSSSYSSSSYSSLDETFIPKQKCPNRSKTKGTQSSGPVTRKKASSTVPQ